MILFVRVRRNMVIHVCVYHVVCLHDCLLGFVCVRPCVCVVTYVCKSFDSCACVVTWLFTRVCHMAFAIVCWLLTCWFVCVQMFLLVCASDHGCSLVCVPNGLHDCVVGC